MPKKNAPLSMRINEATKAAIEAAAGDEERSVSSFVERVLARWLSDNGYLEKPTTKKVRR